MANEPQYPESEWVTEVGKFIKSIDKNHMISTGVESRYDYQDFLNSHESHYIDYCTVHIWAQNRGVYNMTDPSESNIARAIDWALGWVEKVDSWASRLKKPLILEEFGMPRDNFESDEVYSPEHPTTRKDRYFQEVLKLVVQSFQSKGAYAGFGFWAYGGESRPGDKIVGDPPHEPPGWYDVYDKDNSTAAVMKNAIVSIHTLY